MNLSFDNAEVKDSGFTADPNKQRVMKPGIYEVITSSLKSGVIDNEKQTPYIDWTVENRDKEILTHRYYTSTNVKSGSTMSAWDITANSILQLVIAITGVSKDDAKKKLTDLAVSSKTNDEFTIKLSSLVIGKPFQLKVNGEEVISGTTNNKFTKSKFGNYTFAIGIKEEVKKLGKVYIKPLPVANTATTSSSELPF